MKNLSEAVEITSQWMSQWEDEFAANELELDDEAREEEGRAIQAFGLLVKLAKQRQKTNQEECPHAAPHRYCSGCKVSPCPLGLHQSQAATKADAEGT